MSDYNSGKVYKIFVEGADDLCYIGSTINTLTHRLSEHRYSAKSDAQYKFASAPFFQEGNNVLIELLEAYPCNSKQELLAKEAEWLLKFPEALNKTTPILDAEERHKRRNAICLKNYHDNREAKMKSHKEWVEANKEYIAEYSKTMRPINREKEKERYANGYGEARNAKKKEKAKCDICDKEMNKNSIWTHKKSVHV